MECPICGTEMERETSVEDGFDPTTPHGHVQNESEVWVCPACENVEPYIKEEEDYE